VARLEADGIDWIGLIAERKTHPFYRPLGFSPMADAVPMLKDIMINFKELTPSDYATYLSLFRQPTLYLCAYSLVLHHRLEQHGVPALGR
jgi:hypothetical protein